jgi:CMP/dCMP kinase
LCFGEFQLIVTIDGPAGAGKSSVAKRLASELGFDFLDTGAMYRCVTLACLKNGLRTDDSETVSKLAGELKIELTAMGVFLNGENVSEEIRNPKVTKSIQAIADNTKVRQILVLSQRAWSLGKNAVTEGRDQGTVAFPDAECKIFLTATPFERARRRVNQLLELGVDVSFEEVLDLQNQRDEQDMNREEGGLKPAVDSISIWTDGMTETQVLQKLVEIVFRKRELVSSESYSDSSIDRSEEIQSSQLP